MSGAGRNRDDGFTLIELLMVLGIMALMAVISVPLMRRESPGQDLTAASLDLAAGLRLARAAARSGNAEQALVVSLDRRLYWVDGLLPARAFGRRLDVVLDVPESERPGTETGRVRFFPDGTATPARVTLRVGRLETILAVDWLTGEIRTGAP